MSWWEPKKAKSLTDREMQRLRSLTGAFTKQDRLMTGDMKISVRVATPDDLTSYSGPGINMSDVPGFSSYPDIFINHEKFKEFKSAKTLVQLLGLNYHELAHFLFTPRRVQYTPPAGTNLAFNVLEDQRIESFFTAMYGPSGKYFTEMVVRFYVEVQEMWGSAFMLTYGRSYLPLEMRQEFEDRFMLPQHIGELKDLIRRYKTFKLGDFTNHRVKVNNVVKRFQQIIDELQQQGGSAGDSCQSPEQQNQGSPDESREEDAQQKDRKRSNKEERTGEDQSDFWDEEEEEGDDSGDEEEEGDGGDSEEEESDSDSDSESDAGDGDGSESESDSDADGEDEGTDGGDGDSSSDESGSGEEGEGSGEDTAEGGDSEDDPTDEEPVENDAGGSGEGGGGIFESDQDFEDYMNEVTEAIHEDASVQQEVGVLNAAMNDFNQMDYLEFGKENYAEHDPSEVAKNIVTQISRELQRLYADVEPNWKYGSDVGKLNIDRAIHDPENFEEMFDEWDEGQEQDSGLEVFISLDISGSMGFGSIQQGKVIKPIVAASEAMWIIKRGLDEVEANVTVVGFHEETKGLFSRDDKVSTGFFPVWTNLGGSTQPVGSILMGRRVLGASEMPNKLFVIITDGGMSGYNPETQETDDLGDLIDTIEARKIYVGLGNPTQNRELQDKFNVWKILDNPMDLVEIVNHAVTQMLMSRRH